MHSLQSHSVADEHCDITCIKYEKDSVDEIRLHHTFEHFPKVMALSLLAVWREAIRPGGRLVIEVPDLKMQSLYLLLLSSNSKKEFISSRHLFGSQEAKWAIHYEGYTPGMLKFILKKFGFENIKIRRNYWRGTFNFTISADKSDKLINIESAAESIFELYTVDSSNGENKLKQIWLAEFLKNLESKKND